MKDSIKCGEFIGQFAIGLDTVTGVAISEADLSGKQWFVVDKWAMNKITGNTITLCLPE